MAKKPTRTAKSEIEAKSRASTGAQSVSVYLLPEERELWARVAEKRGMSKKDAFVAGLRALQGANAPTDAELLAMLQARLAERPERTILINRKVKVE